ncbi:MAG: glycosyltransferase family 2 protein [candidate division Zixibacteria bacterium]
MSNKISAVIITKNEEENITAAIESVRFADQIVVADTNSDDNTAELARNAGAEVFNISFDGFGRTKNKALEFCTGDWIISLDADERVSPELSRGILDAVNNEDGLDCYAINRLTYFLGKPVKRSGWFPDYVVRLFKNGYRFSDSLVHESVETKGEVGKIPGYLYHHSYRDLHQYMEKLNNYTSLNAAQMSETGKRGSLLDMIIHPPAVFLKMFVFKVGFLDGITGFLLAVLSSYHVFVKYAKLRQISRQK